MNEHLAHQAETEKLARLLDVTPQDLEFLRDLPSDRIHAVAERISDTLFDAGEDKLKRVAAASKIVPGALAAAFAQKYFGPLMSARVAVMLDPKKASELARHLPAKFMAKVSLHLDPRRAKDIIARVPDDLVVAVASELVAMREFITMGRFVGYVSHSAILRAIENLSPEELLHTAFFVEAQERFDEIAAALPDERIGALIRSAASDGLWTQALSLVDAVNDENKTRLANIAAEQDDATLTSMAQSVHEQDLYEVILPLVTLMNDANRQRLAALPYLHQPEVLTHIVGTASANDLWYDLLPLAELLPEDALERVAGAVANLPEDLLVGAIHAAHRHRQWPALFAVAEHLDDDSRSELLGLLESFEDEVIEAFIETAAGDEVLVDRAMRLLDTAQPRHLDPVLKRISELDATRRAEILGRAGELGVTDRLGPIAAALRG